MHKVEWLHLSEMMNFLKLSQYELYNIILPMADFCLVFHTPQGYRINPLGKGVLEAISILEDAVGGAEIVLFDISRDKPEKITNTLDRLLN